MMVPIKPEVEYYCRNSGLFALRVSGESSGLAETGSLSFAQTLFFSSGTQA